MNMTWFAVPHTRVSVRALCGGLLVGGLLCAVAGAMAFLQVPAEPSVESLLEGGLVAAEWGDYEAAREASISLEQRRCFVESELIQAKILLAKGYIQPAVDLLGEADSTTRGRHWQTLLAEAAQRQGRHRDVRRLLAPVTAAYPDDPVPHRLLAASYYDVGAIDDAVRHLRQAAALDGQDPRPMRLLGVIYSDYEMYDEAIPFYEESLRRSPLQPDRDELLRELARCHVEQRQYEQALAALQLAPASPESQLLRAECLVALGKTAEARDVVGAVLEVVPENVEALVLRGKILLDDGEPEAAIEPLEKAARDPNDYVAHLTLARAFAQVGREDDAAREQEVADGIRTLRKEFADLHKQAWENPEDPQVRMQLAAMAGQLGRPDLAEVWRAAATAVSENAGSVDE